MVCDCYSIINQISVAERDPRVLIKYEWKTKWMGIVSIETNPESHVPYSKNAYDCCSIIKQISKSEKDPRVIIKNKWERDLFLQKQIPIHMFLILRRFAIATALLIKYQ